MNREVADRKLPLIIGISGKIGSGKDTVANIIKEYGYQNGVYYNVCPFAENVKEVVSLITGSTIEEQYTREGKAKIPNNLPYTLGRYQQIIGQGMRDLISPDVWVNCVMMKEGPKIIPDVRYPSEVTAIEAAGGIVIRLKRDNIKYEDGRDYTHVSETALDDYEFKHVLVNGDGQNRVVYMTIKKLLDEYK